MCAPPESTWSDPLLWKSVFTAIGVIGIYLGVRISIHLLYIQKALIAIADEVRDSRAKLISAIAMLGRDVDRVGSKIEGRTAIERRKQVS